MQNLPTLEAFPVKSYDKLRYADTDTLCYRADPDAVGPRVLLTGEVGRIPAVVAGEALANHRSQGFGGMAGSAWLRRPQSRGLYCG